MFFLDGTQNGPKNGRLPREDNKTMVSELNREPCGQCEGPFEFWGLSAISKAYRCITCQVIQFVPKSNSHETSDPVIIVNRRTP